MYSSTGYGDQNIARQYICDIHLYKHTLAISVVEIHTISTCNKMSINALRSQAPYQQSPYSKQFIGGTTSVW